MNKHSYAVEQAMDVIGIPESPRTLTAHIFGTFTKSYKCPILSRMFSVVPVLGSGGQSLYVTFKKDIK